MLRDTLGAEEKRKIERADSNRGIAGDVSPAWGAYEGAGPLCRSVSSFSERDFEYPTLSAIKNGAER